MALSKSVGGKTVERTYRDRLAALDQIWRVWTVLGDGLTDGQWTAPSRCAGWDVAALYAHHTQMPRLLDTSLPDVDVPGEPVTAAEVLCRFNAPGGVAHTLAARVGEHAVADAAAHAGVELVDRFRVLGTSLLHRLRATPATLIVPWPGGAVLPVAEAVRIVLMEATVHLLDVQRALNRPPDVPAAALAETARLLAEMAPAVELIEAATGRSPHSPLPILR